MLKLRRLSARARTLAGAFARRDDAVSAVEFALLAPILVTMLGGAIELSGAITAANRSTYVADALGEMVSRVDHRITKDEIKNFALTSALIDTDIIRYANASGKNVDKSFKVTISSVQFTPKVADCIALSCEYKAEVIFSYSANGKKRACGELKPAAAGAQTGATLPSDVFGPGSLVVVDVETFYSPTIPVSLGKTISFTRSSYFRPRYLPRIEYQKNCDNDDDDDDD